MIPKCLKLLVTAKIKKKGYECIFMDLSEMTPSVNLWNYHGF